MATLRAFQSLDMDAIIRAGTLTRGAGRADLVSGPWSTVLTGTFPAEGNRGTVTGYTGSITSVPVFEATGVERSATTIFAILADRDNGAFLAYTLSDGDTILGSGAADTLVGFGGDDMIRGGAGDDDLYGGSDRDTLDGGAGNDFLAGGLDTDLLRGGPGADTYLVDTPGDRIVEAADGNGRDVILTTASLVIAAHVERLVLIGTGRIDATGSARADDLEGNETANRLVGGGGRDRLDGDGGSDTLVGGADADTLIGGTGADTFLFRTPAEARGDLVADFTRGSDRLDFSAIDADTTRAGNQAFHLATPHAGSPGTLTLGPGWITGDANGDGLPDFTLRLAGITAAAGDILV